MTNNITVVDALMGTGKSSWIIDYVNVTDKNKRILVVVLYKEQYRRLNQATNRRLKMIDDDEQNKTITCKLLIERDVDIVITHSLFKSLPPETIQLLKEKDYMVIIDESPVVIEDMKLQKGSVAVLKDAKRISIDESTKKVSWAGDAGEVSLFQTVEKACSDKMVYCYADSGLIAMLPPEYLTGFSEVYIFTYLFDFQLIAVYFKFFNISFIKKSLMTDYKGRRCLVDYDEKLDNRAQVYALMNINQSAKHNEIGKRRGGLSKSNLENKAVRVKLKKKFNTYFKGLDAKSEDIMWTVFKDAYEETKGYGYTKGFIECNKKASNEHQDKSILMYGCNMFLSPIVMNFFSAENIEINGERFAVNELLQWVWRSRIRKGEPIDMYLPSKRMRDALEKWSNYEL